MAPGHVLTFDRAVAPQPSRAAGDDRRDLFEGRGHTLFRQRRDRLVGNAARHDVLAHEAHVGVDVEREPVHRATPCQPHSDGADLPRLRAVDTDPHAGMLGKAADACHAQLLERSHDQPLDRGDVIARPHRVRYTDDRIPHQLPRPVVRHVAAPLHRHELRAHRGRVDEDVGREVGAWSVGEDVRVLEQQEVILTTVFEQGRLDVERLPIRNASQPADT